MSQRESDLARSLGDTRAVRHMQAWLLLVGSVALHVVDEALTDFLDFYNPLVRRIRSEIPWFPMPTFTTGIWLAGLAIFVLILASLAPGVRHGGTAIRLLSWVLGVVMLLNGVGHLVGSLYFQRWLPGATTAPLLLATSVLLMRATWHRYHSD
jgi:hypothetical protein